VRACACVEFVLVLLRMIEAAIDWLMLMLTEPSEESDGERHFDVGRRPSFRTPTPTPAQTSLSLSLARSHLAAIAVTERLLCSVSGVGVGYARDG